MKLNKKSRAKIFDLHVGLTFDWRETGILRWRILLWMLLFGVCASVAAVFVHVEVPGVRRRGDQPGAVVLLPADNPRLHQYVLRNTPLPVRGPVWADPVTAGPIGETGVTLPSLRSADTPLAPLPPVSVPTVADQVWRMWQHPDFHIRAMMILPWMFPARAFPTCLFVLRGWTAGLLQPAPCPVFPGARTIRG